MQELFLEFERYKAIIIEEELKDLVFTATDEDYNVVDTKDTHKVSFGDLLTRLLVELKYDQKKIRDTTDQEYIKIIQKLQLKER